jgi:hypothetical protein
MIVEKFGNNFCVSFNGSNKSYLGFMIPIEIVECLENGQWDTTEAKLIRNFFVYANNYHWTFEKTVNELNKLKRERLLFRWWKSQQRGFE